MNTVKLFTAVGNSAGQQVQPPGRAFGIGNRLNAVGQVQRLHQLDHIDAAFFQHVAVGQINLMHLKAGQAVGNRAAMPGQKRSTHPPRPCPQTQVQARRLNLLWNDRGIGADLVRGNHGFQLLAGQHTDHKISP